MASMPCFQEPSKPSRAPRLAAWVLAVITSTFSVLSIGEGAMLAGLGAAAGWWELLFMGCAWIGTGLALGALALTLIRFLRR